MRFNTVWIGGEESWVEEEEEDCEMKRFLVCSELPSHLDRTLSVRVSPGDINMPPPKAMVYYVQFRSSCSTGLSRQPIAPACC